MNDSLYQKVPLVPLTQITENNIRNLRIGEDFVDLARLGMIGEFIKVDATELCPRLYYRWSYQFGEWEIYACEHDLIAYNLLGVVKLKKDSKDGGGSDSGGGDTPDTPDDPTPTPTPDDYKVDVTSTDSDWTFNGAIITFNGKIKWYPERLGHYVPVTFKIGSDYLQYMDTLVVTYRGAKYGKTIFNNGVTDLLISVRVPGQLVPIRFDFTEDIHAQYFIKISNSAKFEVPYNL